MGGGRETVWGREGGEREGDNGLRLEEKTVG